MVAKRRFTTGLVLTILLLLPREGAAFWNWLHELSGPGPFWSVVFGCTAELDFSDWCDEISWPVVGVNSAEEEKRFRWRTEGSFAWSYRNDFSPRGETVYWTSVNLLGEYRIPVVKGRVEVFPAFGPRLDAFYGQEMSLTVNGGVTARLSGAVRLFSTRTRHVWLEVGPEGRAFFRRLNGSDFGVIPGNDLERFVRGWYLGFRLSHVNNDSGT